MVCHRPMELNFLRHDLATTAATNRFCLRVLPAGKKPKQKIVVGDTAGTVQALSLGKSNELESAFKMSPAAPGTPSKPISFIDLSGDKIFVAAGEVISGITRKGRAFYRLATFLSESINSMVVRTPLIWTTSEYVLNVFEDGKEVNFYMAPDKVNHLVVEPVSSETVLESIVACTDRKLRVVKQNELTSEHPVEGAARTVAVYTTKNSTHRDVLYGTDSGHLGAYRIGAAGLQKRWVKLDDAAGGVNCIVPYDFTNDGVTDILVGRDNGSLEIFNFEGGASEPTLLYRTNLNEAITGMDIGRITNPTQEEIAISTYSGKVLCFSTHGAQPLDASVSMSSSTSSAAASKQVELLKKRGEKKALVVQQDIERLKERLEKRKAEYSGLSENHIAVGVDFRLKDKWVLDASACWILTIELDCPIESVALQCDVDVELLDVDANGAIISRSKPEPDSKSKLLAIYRSTETISRMEIKVRTVEGQHGTLQAFVIPKLSPKTAQLAAYDIRPLSLHQRLTQKPASFDTTPMNSVSFSGPFSLADMLAWLGQCIPNVPEKAQGDELLLYFQSTFQETLLCAKLRAGDAQFRSDNVSTLAILKDFITRQATNRKMQIKSPFEIKDETCNNVLQLLHPKLEYQLSLSEKVKLIEALKEVAMQEQDVSFLTEQYRDILDKAKAIEAEFELQPRCLEFLCGIVKGLYLDKARFRGQNLSHKLPVLQGLLEKYDLRELQAFFQQA